MAIGRNAPCPCGSGKKYKKCCLQKDEDARREAARAAAEQFEPLEEPPMGAAAEPWEGLGEQDPHLQAMDEQWDAFEAAGYEDKVALFSQSLDEAEGIDSETAFEMLNAIYPEAVRRDERDRFDSLIRTLGEKQPELYDDDAPFYLDWLVTNALAKDHSDLSDLMRQMAPLAGRDIDIFNNVVDRLAYHGQTVVLAEAMRTAWPKVKNSAGILEWGIDEFAMRGFDCALFCYLERVPSATATAPELLAQVEFFRPSDPEGLGNFLAHLSGQAQRDWRLEDFKFKYRRMPRPKSDKEEAIRDPGRQNLFDLTVEFLGYLRREEDVPYTRGEMGRASLFEYIVDRYAGELPSGENLLESMERQRQGWRRPKQRRPDHLLCPDSATLDRYLGGLLHFVNPQHYKVATTFELVPAWLRFLESRQLLEAERRAAALNEVGELYASVSEFFASYRDDPALSRDVRSAWQGVAG